MYIKKGRKSITHLIGQKFGRLTILEEVDRVNSKTYVRAICECNVIKDYRLSFLISGNTRSCGCLRHEIQSRPGKTAKHNLTSHPLSAVWHAMISRCYAKSSVSYPNYGEKGVIVCDEWKNSLQKFFDWAINNGWKKGLQIDKDKLSPFMTGIIYSPEFCCFITRTENIRLRRTTKLIEYKNEIKPLAEWCEILNINYKITWQRLRENMSVEMAFEKPNNGHKKK